MYLSSYLFKLLNFNSFIIELFNSKILFNENLSTDISINIIANNNNRIFSSSIINFNIANAKDDGHFPSMGQSSDATCCRNRCVADASQ